MTEQSKGRRLKVKAQRDFIDRLAQAPRIAALEELIWNSFDERAHQVIVAMTLNDMGGVEEITIADDGQSLPYESAAQAFENLGKSNKVGRSLETGERLHGRKGEGRHKALSLGNTVTWNFTYSKNRQRYSYQVIGSAHREDPFYLTAERPATETDKVGCRVAITDIEKSLHALTVPETRLQVASVFAPFLIRHADRQLIFQGKAIRPTDVIEEQRRLRPFKVVHGGMPYTISVEVLHWTEGQRKEVFLCSSSGIPLHEINSRSLSATENFSVFATSELFDQLHDQNLLSSVEMTADSGRKDIIAKVRQKVRGYFRRRLQGESDEALQRLRDEGSYPYTHEPRSGIDQIERRVFDLCTVNISRHLPSFSEKMDVDGRKLLLRVVREALSKNPTSVGKIIREVCRLPENTAKSFARLLDDVPLGNVVHLAKMVSERLHFLTLFEAVVHLDPFDRVIEERTQLQKLLEQNTWLFGEEYAAGTGDENLVAVLQKHMAILGRDHLQPSLSDHDIRKMINDFNKQRTKTPESLARIPDLMLWQKFIERRPDEYEFLIIEIKRPGVAIGRKEIAQIEDYAKAVVTTPFADTDRTRWVFVLVSDDLDDHAHDRAHQQGLPAYTIQRPVDGKYEIRVIPWSQLIRAARARHEHLQKWLDVSPSRDKVFALAEETYSEFLPKAKKKSARPR
jgi:hypothetical protein